MSQQDSFVLASADKEKILSKTSKTLDRCEEKPSLYLAKSSKFVYYHTRPLPKSVATKAIKYISFIAAKYPFQLRMQVAAPLWDRFCEQWCETGDEAKSLKAV